MKRDVKRVKERNKGRCILQIESPLYLGTKRHTFLNPRRADHRNCCTFPKAVLSILIDWEVYPRITVAVSETAHCAAVHGITCATCTPQDGLTIASDELSLENYTSSYTATTPISSRRLHKSGMGSTIPCVVSHVEAPPVGRHKASYSRILPHRCMAVNTALS